MSDSNASDSSRPSGVPGSDAYDRRLEGTGVAPGLSIGPAFCLSNQRPSIARSFIMPDHLEDELDLFTDAVERSAAEVERMAALARKKLGADSAAIFDAQLMMLQDETLLEAVSVRIVENRQNAASALHDVMRSHRSRIEESEDAYLRERANDLYEVETRVLNELQRTKAETALPPDPIVVGASLTTTNVIQFGKHGVLGFATEDGSPTSHVSILARALGIPAVSGVSDALDAVEDGDTVILDGRRGELIARPSEATLADYRTRRSHYQSILDAQSQLATQPSVTTDGHRVALQANVEFGEEIDLLSRHGAEGIGLLRTEMLFLAQSDSYLSEEEQYEVYARAANATGDHGVTIRLLDFGGDKGLPGAEKETNPFLGWRGVRVLLDRPELLRPQLRAVLRAATRGTVRLLIPMVTSCEEIDAICSALDEERDRLESDGVPCGPVDVGAMVEVPSAALQADLLAKHVDFFSVGTNDLTQYVLAVDRTNERVADRHDSLHPAVLGLIRTIVDAADEARIPVSLCGEIAADPSAVPLLVGLGVDALSATPGALLPVKRVVRALRHDDAVALAGDALGDSDAAAVRARLKRWTQDRPDVCRAVHGPDLCPPSGDATASR